MPSPQSEYSYDQLQKYLVVAETALSNFEEKYPDLGLDYVNPRGVAINILNDFADKVNDGFNREVAYLDLEEQDTATLGTRALWNKHGKLSTLYKRLDKAQEIMSDDLTAAFELGYVNILNILRQIENETAGFTAERIMKHEWHTQWLEKQKHWYAYYHLKECKKYSACKSLDVRFACVPGELPREPGVYFLFYRGDLVYIGHTSNLQKRIRNHSVVRKYYFKNEANEYSIDCVYATLPKEKAMEIERKLIDIARPIDNVQGNDNAKKP